MTEQVICEREYTAMVDGEAFPLLVQWTKPVSDRGDWRCDYSINWPDRPVRRSHAMGVDSTQALVLALFLVGTELETGPCPVRWLDGLSGLGLPGIEPPITDLPGGLDRPATRP